MFLLNTIKFIIMTRRRYYLDNLLNHQDFSGNILDIGGKKENKRGNFDPNKFTKVKSWEYLNIDAETKPDYLMDLSALSSITKKFDFVLICEVFEHIENPEQLIIDVFKILKENGRLIISMPFLYPNHADPNDYQRWTKDKFHLEFKKSNLKLNNIISMGGLFSVFHDMIHFSFYNSNYKNSLWKKLVVKVILKIFWIVSNLHEIKLKKEINHTTTGYFVIASK